MEVECPMEYSPAVDSVNQAPRWGSHLRQERISVTRKRSRKAPEAAQVSGMAPDVCRVIEAVCRSISLHEIELPDTFFPAHLPVALIDAIFRPRLRYEEGTVPMAERYCRHFGIARRRTNRWKPPPADGQERLGALVRHYDELGVEGMASEVFQIRHHLPEATVSRVEHVLYAAHALRRIGIEVLQDVWTRSFVEIDDALRSLPDIDECTARRLMMYTGSDDFVQGDVYVRSFVASAIGRKTISAAQAEALVQSAAYEMILSPRFLDREIWRYGVSR